MLTFLLLSLHVALAGFLVWRRWKLLAAMVVGFLIVMLVQRMIFVNVPTINAVATALDLGESGAKFFKISLPVLIEEIFKLAVICYCTNWTAKDAIRVGAIFGVIETVTKLLMRMMSGAFIESLMVAIFFVSIRGVTTIMHAGTSWVSGNLLRTDNIKFKILYFISAVSIHATYNFFIFSA